MSTLAFGLVNLTAGMDPISSGIKWFFVLFKRRNQCSRFLLFCLGKRLKGPFLHIKKLTLIFWSKLLKVNHQILQQKCSLLSSKCSHCWTISIDWPANAQSRKSAHFGQLFRWKWRAFSNVTFGVSCNGVQRALSLFLFLRAKIQIRRDCSCLASSKFLGQKGLGSA